jgi:hypothetical protein
MKDATVAESKNPAGLDGSTSVSALGLRWAALRGMLASPLIEAEEQRSLREDLLRELQAIEQDFATLPARNTIELSAKIDVVKTALRQSAVDGQGWLTSLLESVQSDLRATIPRAPTGRPERGPAALSRNFPNRAEANVTPPQPQAQSAEAEPPSIT